MADPIKTTNLEGYEGIPSQYKQDINAPLPRLILSTHPATLTDVRKIEPSATELAPFTVMGVNAAGNMVPADATHPAIAILATPVPANTGTEPLGAQLYFAGHFHIDRLVWDAAVYPDDAAKFAAFNGGTNLTQIRLGRQRTGNA